METSTLEEHARNIRIKTLDSLYKAQSGHVGPSLSIVEVLTTLYFDEMNLDSEEVTERDVLVLSKGHAAPSLYATLAERGLLEESLLDTLRDINSPLQGHPERHRLTYVDATTGSLGQGLAMAQGYALAKKLSGESDNVYCIIGDGETQEGQIWETAMSAPKFKLDNLFVFTDYNKFQNECSIAETMPLDDLGDKWRAFGWDVYEIDGHDYDQIKKAIADGGSPNGKPTMIIANT
ncbi:transketolase, partial [Candidatus Woesearchaeota archaeon]|nr:transketolase [Candidatus Woesearchaeota archaeon]